MRQAIPFGKYLLLDRISVGGMAEVFKAKSYGVEGFEKVIAIKRILPSMGEDRDFIKMFIDEAKIAGQLAHANICQIFELGRIEGAHFIAMEFIWGKDLLQIQNRLRKLKQTMSAAMACFIVGKVCEGLDYAHRKKDALGRPLEIVHRDCSPQNVLISYEGEVKIIDFGIAKAASRSSRTMHGVLKGKFGYMSPEQVRGLPLDRRSDIFALGTILYECLTGERLFQGDTDFATLEKVRNVDIPLPSSFNPAIPAEVERIIMKALARDVDNRYQWCSEMLADLQGFLMAEPAVFTAKSLSGWMKEGFVGELERERAQLESYKKLGREGLIAGVPAAEAKLDVIEHLGPAGQSEDPTVLGGPSFDDIVGDGATQISASPHDEPPVHAANLPPVAGEVAARLDTVDRDFPEEEGPTTIFGEVGDDDNAPTLNPATSPPPIAAMPPPRARSTHQVPAVPPPRAPTSPPVAAQPASRTLYGMAPPPQPPAFPAGTGRGNQATPPPGYNADAATMIDGDAAQLPVAQLVAQAQAQLAAHQAAAGHNAQAPTMLAMQPPQLPLQPGPQSGLHPPVPQQQYGYPQPHGYPHAPHAPQPWPYPPDPAAYGSGQVAPVYTPSGVLISPPTHPPAHGGDPMISTAVARPERRRRPSLGKDVAIGVGIAAAVLGVVAIVKFAVLGDEGGARRAEAASAGTLVVKVADGGGGDVIVGGEKRGVVENGVATLEKMAAGALEVQVVRDGVDPCTQKVDLAGGETETIECRFAAAPPPPPPPVVAPDAGVVAVAEIADAAPAMPADAAPVAALVPEREPEPEPEPEPKPEPRKRDRDDDDDDRKERDRDEKKDVVKKDDDRKPDTRTERKTTQERPVRTTPKPDPKVAKATNEGYLVAYTTPWAKVLIDGKDTGKMTPIAPRAKIALTPGKHKVTFVVGRETWSYWVTIKGGETSKITKDLPVATP